MQMAVRWTLRSAGGDEMSGAAYFSPSSLGCFNPGKDEQLAAAGGQPLTPALAAGPAALPSQVEQGRRLSEAFGCIACHSTDGTLRAGPTWKGLFGRRVEFANGSSAIADGPYIRAHLRPHPDALVRGFAGGMPNYTGLISEDQTSALVEYLRSLR
jgi:mono/diheme cytochrome c family protein